MDMHHLMNDLKRIQFNLTEHYDLSVDALKFEEAPYRGAGGDINNLAWWIAQLEGEINHDKATK